MIGEALVRHILQTDESERTWEMHQYDLVRKFRYVKTLTTKLNTKSEWDKVISSKHHSNAIKWYTDSYNRTDGIAWGDPGGYTR